MYCETLKNFCEISRANAVEEVPLVLSRQPAGTALSCRAGSRTLRIPAHT